jgi:hypothetical protein
MQAYTTPGVPTHLEPGAIEDGDDVIGPEAEQDGLPAAREVECRSS